MHLLLPMEADLQPRLWRTIVRLVLSLKADLMEGGITGMDPVEKGKATDVNINKKPRISGAFLIVAKTP